MTDETNPTTADLQSCATRVATTVDRPVDAVTVGYAHYTNTGADDGPTGWYWTITVSMRRARSTRGYSSDITGVGDNGSLAGLNQAADEVIENVRRGREAGKLI